MTLVLVLVPLACSFPSYGFAGSIGAAGVGGVSGGSAGALNGGAGAGASAGAPGGTAGRGDSGGSSVAGSGVSTGGALPACVPADGEAGAGMVDVNDTTSLPTHCRNGKKDSSETALDCGGPDCAKCYHADGCQHPGDCASGVCTPSSTCEQEFFLQLQSIVNIRNTNTLQFKLQLTYLGTAPVHLTDLALRYYFYRGDVSDPVVPFSTIALLNGTSITPQTVWNIVRVLPTASSLVDSYLEVTFTTTKVLITGDVVELTQSIENGSAAGIQFDQDTHYSYQNVSTYTEEDTATVYRAGTLMWGVPPAYAAPEQCFFGAFNFGGDAASAGGIAFSAGSDPSVQFGGTVFHTDTSSPDNTTPYPLPDDSYLPVLESAFVLDSSAATLTVPNGNYWVYPYLITGDGSNFANLVLQGKSVATFTAESVSGGPAWARLGPFPVTVTANALTLSAKNGLVRVAGIELYASAAQ